MNTIRTFVKEAFVFGWKSFKATPWLFIAAPLVLMAITIGIAFVEEILGAVFGDEKMELVIYIESAITTFLMSIGMVALYLKAHDTPLTTELRDLWHPKPFWRYVGVTILGGLAVMVGLILFIVPGIIIAIAFSFAGLLVVDRGLGPVAALKESVRLTKGHRLQLFVLGLANVGTNIIGFCVLLVGLLVTGPITEMAFVHAYKTIRNADSAHSA